MQQTLSSQTHPREAKVYTNSYQSVNHRVWDEEARDCKGHLLSGMSSHGPEIKGRPPWELELMEIGDTLHVFKEVRSFPQVYNYVKTRGWALGRFFTVERTGKGALVTRTATAQRSADPAAVKREGPVDKPFDWGIIEKIGRKWRWPFKEMELGDVFRVDPVDVSIDAVRERSYRHSGKHFAVTMDGSWIRVQRVIEPNVGWDCVKYGIVRMRVGELFEAIKPEHAFDWPHEKMVLLDMVPFPQDVGEHVDVSATLVGEMPKRTSYVFEAVVTRSGEFERFALDMEEQGFRVTRVSPDVTQKLWDDGKLDPDPFS